MKKSKKLLALLLAVLLAVSALALPVSAAGAGSIGTRYPTVFVHGLMGWGSYDRINDIVPYWGMTTGDLMTYLQGQGCECYSASVGPLSSAWDRACELYAQLKGTVVDYGAAHAAKYGHSRWGQDFTGAGSNSFTKLLPGVWDAKHPINLVGHSFGGATIRLFADILADGSAEEQAYSRAHPDAARPLSDFFTGGKGDWVHSLTTVAAPSNGTTFIEANSDATAAAAVLVTAMAKTLGISDLKGVYDFRLEQFGIYADPDETICQALTRVLSSGFLLHNDNAFEDLTIDRATDLNKGIEMQGAIYYFSYYGNRTCYNSTTKSYQPTLRMWLPFQPFSLKMCRYSGTTAGWYFDGYGAGLKTVRVAPTKVNKTWQPNDGMVNVVSGQWPFHYDRRGVRHDDNHAPGTVGMTGAKTAVWYVMPEQSVDHIGFVGSFFNEDILSTHAFYRGLMSNIVNCGG